MRLLTRLLARAATELAQNPEARGKAAKVLKEDVKPAAQKAWTKAQPEIESAKSGLTDFARKVRDEYRKGRYGS